MNVVSEIDLLSGVKRTSRQNENAKSPEISRAEHEFFCTSCLRFASLTSQKIQSPALASVRWAGAISGSNGNIDFSKE